MAVYLYTPPQWRHIIQLEGSLRVGIPTSFCVYRKGGVWHSTQTPAVDELTGVDFYTDPASGLGMTLLFDRPKVIPGSLQPDLAAFGQGTLTLL